MKMEDYLNSICGITDSYKIANGITQIIDAIAEVEINGIKYQAQIVLEPRENYYVPEDKVTIRLTVDDDFNL